jgi:hypothetical protein
MPMISGNGGDILVHHTGKVVGYNPSVEVADGEHEGYFDVVKVDLEEWCRYYRKANHEMPMHFDILDVDCILSTGERIPAEVDWRMLAEAEMLDACYASAGDIGNPLADEESPDYFNRYIAGDR